MPIKLNLAPFWAKLSPNDLILSAKPLQLLFWLTRLLTGPLQRDFNSPWPQVGPRAEKGAKTLTRNKLNSSSGSTDCDLWPPWRGKTKEGFQPLRVKQPPFFFFLQKVCNSVNLMRLKADLHIFTYGAGYASMLLCAVVLICTSPQMLQQHRPKHLGFFGESCKAAASQMFQCGSFSAGDGIPSF